jgi:uncharacterized DUF497 family protein
MYEHEAFVLGGHPHGLGSLADSEGVFEDPFASRVEDPDAAGEQRFIAVGMGGAGQVLVVSYTYRVDDIRPISARRAS